MKKLKGNNESFSFSSFPYIYPFIPAEEYKWLNIKKGMTRKKKLFGSCFCCRIFSWLFGKNKKKTFSCDEKEVQLFILI